MKEFLSQRGVAFIEKTVDEDETAYDELMSLGYRAVPVTVIDGFAIAGFDPEGLDQAITGAGR